MEENILSSEKNLSLWQKIGLLFWEPSATFRALARKTGWLDIAIPVLLGLIVLIAVTEKITPLTTSYAKEMILQNEKIPAEQRASLFERIEKQQHSPMKYVWIVISVLLKVAVVAGFFLLVNNFIVGGTGGYVQGLAVVSYVNLVDIVAMAVRTPLMLAQETVKVYTSPALFIEESKTFFFRFMAGLDLFAFWKTILLAVAVSAFTPKKFKPALAAFIIFWLIYVALMALLGGLAQM